MFRPMEKSPRFGSACPATTAADAVYAGCDALAEAIVKGEAKLPPVRWRCRCGSKNFSCHGTAVEDFVRKVAFVQMLRLLRQDPFYL